MSDERPVDVDALIRMAVRLDLAAAPLERRSRVVDDHVRDIGTPALASALAAVDDRIRASAARDADGAERIADFCRVVARNVTGADDAVAQLTSSDPHGGR